MQTLNQVIKDGYFTFQFYTNRPDIIMLNVLKESEKAVFVEHEEYKNKVWLPKSALMPTKAGSFTLKKWLKTKLLNEHDVYKLNALGI